MSVDVTGLRTIEIRLQAFRDARARGGLCANCGRTLAEGETVWLERCRLPGDPIARLRAPLGIECASVEVLARTKGQEAEQCAGCGRGVYYSVSNSNRRQALCSKRCAARVAAVRRQQAKE